MVRKFRQECRSCRARFVGSEKHVGKTIKCPKCGQPVTIDGSFAIDPDAGSSSAVNAAARPAKPVPAKPVPAKPVPAKAAPPKPAPAKAAPAPAPAAVRPAPQAKPPGGSGIAIQTDNAPSVGVAGPAAKSSLRHRRRKPAGANIVVGAMIAGGAVVVLLMVAAVGLLFGPSSDSDDALHANKDSSHPRATSRADRPTGSSRPGQSNQDTSPEGGSFPEPGGGVFAAPGVSGDSGQSWNVFVLDLSDRERREVDVQIDGERQRIPELGPVSFHLATGQHELLLRRRGYEPITHSFHLGASDLQSFKPRWQLAGVASIDPPKPIGGQNGTLDFSDWHQDFEAAKRQAASENKDILIAFNGSDWCGWCIRLMYEVFFQQEFRQRIEPGFVLVQIDSPRTAKGRSKVQDMHRNEAMLERFDVRGFPTVVLCDSQGQVYAEGGYVQGGVDAFMRQIEQLQGYRRQRDRLFAAVENAPGDARVEAAGQAMKWLADNELLRHYGPTLKHWLEIALQEDPQNAKGQYEAFFEIDWMSRIASADRTSLENLRPMFARLKQFNAKFDFQDGDRGARLNLVAASFLALFEQLDEAVAFIDAGLESDPQDPDLKARLQAAARALKHRDVLGSGSGFLVADGGYIMTNYHVIEGEGKAYVRLPGKDKPVPAKVLASDRKQDIALLKVDDPAAGKLSPLPIAAESVGRGSSVGVFGYPLGHATGIGLKLTTGVISALPDVANEGMLLLDCRVNPGNSGGPLCNTYGQVVGLVTAKSGGGENVDSYGMARPGDDLIAFLKQHLPSYRPPAANTKDRLEWDQVDRRVSNSVLMIVIKKS